MQDQFSDNRSLLLLTKAVTLVNSKPMWERTAEWKMEYPDEDKASHFRSKPLKLDPGRYRIRLHYEIKGAVPGRSNDSDNLFAVKVKSENSGQEWHNIFLPRKLRPNPGQISLCQVDLQIEAPDAIVCEITMFDVGQIVIERLTLKQLFEKLPEQPAALFICDDASMNSEYCVHQGLSAIAAYLDKQEIAVHAAFTSTCNIDCILGKIARYKYKYVGFHVISIAETLASINALIGHIKRQFPEIIVMIGGPHATLAGEASMREIPEIDMCVVGEGEKTCLELFQNKNLNEIQGLMYRKNDTIHKNASRPLIDDMSELPVPNRDIYFYNAWKAHSISTSRGCPMQCLYCIGSRIFGRKIRFRPLASIDNELKWLYENGDHALIVSINDDLFNMNKQRTLDLMEIFKKYPFYYFARGIRADRIDDDIAKAMRDGGILSVGMGIESADNEALKQMQKNETIEQIQQGIDHLRRYEIGVIGQFMIGNIGDTLKTIEKTINWALLQDFDDVNISCAIPFPSTGLEKYITEHHYQLDQPVTVYPDAINGNTTIYFETPIFPLQDRIEAVKTAFEAGLLKRLGGTPKHV